MRERCKRIGCRVLRRVSQGTDSEHDRDRNPAGTIQTSYGPGPGGASPPEPKDLDHACSRLRSGFDKSESNLFCDTVNPRQTESSWGLISRCLRNFGVFHILGIGMDIMIQRCGRVEEPEKVHVCRLGHERRGRDASNAKVAKDPSQSHFFNIYLKTLRNTNCSLGLEGGMICGRPTCTIRI